MQAYGQDNIQRADGLTQSNAMISLVEALPKGSRVGRAPLSLIPDRVESGRSEPPLKIGWSPTWNEAPVWVGQNNQAVQARSSSRHSISSRWQASRPRHRVAGVQATNFFKKNKREFNEPYVYVLINLSLFSSHKIIF